MFQKGSCQCPYKLLSHKRRGKLSFENNETATVNYQIEEFQEFEFDGQVPTLRDRRGRVSHAKGHPDWHPTLSLHQGPLLVLSAGRNLKVFMRTLQGSFQGTAIVSSLASAAKIHFATAMEFRRKTCAAVWVIKGV